MSENKWCPIIDSLLYIPTWIKYVSCNISQSCVTLHVAKLRAENISHGDALVFMQICNSWSEVLVMYKVHEVSMKDTGFKKSAYYMKVMEYQ